jgi:hypothetical protein
MTLPDGIYETPDVGDGWTEDEFNEWADRAQEVSEEVRGMSKGRKRGQSHDLSTDGRDSG